MPRLQNIAKYMTLIIIVMASAANEVVAGSFQQTRWQRYDQIVQQRRRRTGASADDREMPDRHSYRNYLDGIYMGHKWQCVEFARRWMYLNHGYIFDDVAMAYEIFELTSVRDLKNNRRLPLKSFPNGSKHHPEPGCLLIWDEGGEFERTGHVAVVTEVFPDCIRFIEQNVSNRVWPQGRDYSREIKARSRAI